DLGRDVFERKAEASVASVSARANRFVEVSNERLVATTAALEQSEQVNGPRAGLVPERWIGDVVQEAVVGQNVGPRVENDAIAGQSISAGAANLLVPRFDAPRHVSMNDKPDVALVDTHAKRDGGSHHVDLVARKCILIAQPRV